MTKPRRSTEDAKPVLLSIVSDTHAGSTVGLCPPTIALDDGGKYEASTAQRWLWDGWQSFWSTVREIRDREHASLIQVFNGDLVDGNHHNTTQILSGNPNAQAAVVTELLRTPLALNPDAMFFIRGTEAHVGQSASAEERIADGLRRDKRPVVGEAVTGSASHWQRRLNIQGVRLDFAHHGRVGTRPWTKPNVVANLAAEIFMDHAADDAVTGSTPTFPHIAIRSHMHQFVDTGSIHPVRVIQTPAWQLATAYIHRIAPGKLADIGGIVVLIKDGATDVRPVLFRPSREPAWQPTA